ncbi:MAG TPA: HipA domain-containing protein, partial [Usitatibacter sp.]|nr:HipA domain-containing protein [Usitatibacter sp.]
LDRTFKYEAMSLEALLRIANGTRSRALTRIRLFRWCAFNALVGNADAHLKNLSFLVSPAGIELAPHYDLLSTALFEVGNKPAHWGGVEMSIRIGAATKFRELSRDTLLELATGLQIRKDAASKTLEQMCKRMLKGADKVISEFENRKFPKDAVAHHGGELHVLRQIRHVVIKDTCMQLA